MFTITPSPGAVTVDLAGILRDAYGRTQGLVGGREVWMAERGYLCWEEVWERAKRTPSAEKNDFFFIWNGAFCEFWVVFFVPVLARKKCLFSAWRWFAVLWRCTVMYCVILVVIWLTAITASLGSTLLHCNASNLVLEILKHYKIWGTICIGDPSQQILGRWEMSLPVSPSPMPIVAINA